MITDKVLEEKGITGDVDEIRALINAAYADINARFGSPGSQVENYTMTSSSNCALWTKYPIKTVVKLEHGSSFLAADLQEITANVSGGYYIAGVYKLALVNLFFKRCVRISYLRQDDSSKRDQVVTDLVRLGLRYKGGLIQTRKIGDLSITYETNINTAGGYASERERILSQMNRHVRMVA